MSPPIAAPIAAPRARRPAPAVQYQRITLKAFDSHINDTVTVGSYTLPAGVRLALSRFQKSGNGSWDITADYIESGGDDEGVDFALHYESGGKQWRLDIDFVFGFTAEDWADWGQPFRVEHDFTECAPLRQPVMIDDGSGDYM